MTGRRGSVRFDRLMSRLGRRTEAAGSTSPIRGASPSVRARWAVSGMVDATPSTGVRSQRRDRIKLRDVVWMADQLAATQAAGVPLYRALGMLAGQREGKPIGRRLATLQRRIGEGMTFSEALKVDEKIWGGLLCALVSAGEASGSLDASFARGAALLEGRLALRRKIVGALTYPLVVLMVTVVLVAVMLLFVVPKFSEIYDTLGSELPSLTRLVVGASAQAPLVGVVFMVVVTGVVLVLRLARRNETLGFRVDVLKLRLPVVGGLLARGVFARVASTLGSLLTSGVTLLEGLDYAADAAGSVPHRRSLERVRTRLVDGATFSAALEDEKDLWPELMVQLAAVGEEAGSLPTMMDRYAKRTEVEVDASATNLTKLIEPLMMVVIGVVVGVFLLALYLPIFDLGNQIR